MQFLRNQLPNLKKTILKLLSPDTTLNLLRYCILFAGILFKPLCIFTDGKPVKY